MHAYRVVTALCLVVGGCHPHKVGTFEVENNKGRENTLKPWAVRFTMKGRYRDTLVLCVAAILAVTVSYGCAKKNPAPPEPVRAAAVYPADKGVIINERAVIVHRSDESTRRYYRDDRGKLYYVDQNGAVHDIESTARIERGVAGLYYIIDDDNVQYYTDQNGRLFFRDASGRHVYIEESGAGKVIDPLPILRGDSYPRIEHVRSLDYCNDAWRKCTTRCDDSPGLGNKRNCLENCDYQREQCLKPY